MANLTSKELDALEDQLNFEHTCVCKYQAAAQETTETALRNSFHKCRLVYLSDDHSSIFQKTDCFRS